MQDLTSIRPIPPMHAGDTALGYDLANAQLVGLDYEAHVAKGGAVPDVILVRELIALAVHLLCNYSTIRTRCGSPRSPRACTRVFSVTAHTH